MRKIVIFSAISIFMLSNSPAFSQTADEVINKYTEAMGGADKLKSLQSVYMEGVAVMQNGNEIISKVYKVQDKLFRREVEFGMGSVTTIVTDKEGWSSNPRNGGAFEALPKEAVLAQQIELDLAGPLVNYAAKNHKVELVGKETVDGTEAYKIKLTTNAGKELTYFIDTKSYYIIRLAFKPGPGMFGGNRGGQGTGDTEININYSNYQKTPDGFVFPYTVTMGANSMNIEKIEVNKPIDEKLYKPNK